MIDAVQSWALVFLGVVLLTSPAPTLLGPLLLQRFARGSGMEFTFGEDGRLSSGAEIEKLLSKLVWQPTRATGAFVTGMALTLVLMRNGPPLSQSGAKSFAVALVVCAAVAGPCLLLWRFLRPFSADLVDALRPVTGVDDYVGPLRRVVAWFAGAGAMVIPIGAVALSMTDSYDGSKIYWEGLVGLPLCSAGVIVAAEVASRGVRDGVGLPVVVYLWDLLRARSLRKITAVGTFGAALSWKLASDGLVGVAFDAPVRPGWVDTAQALGSFFSAVLFICAVVIAAMPVRRFRSRLWPGLAPETTLRWV